MSEGRVIVKGDAGKGGPKLSVLVIDPDPVSRGHVKDILRGMEHIGQVRDRGLLGSTLDLLDENPFDIIFLDEHQGGSDVLDIVGEIKQLPVAQETNFVLIAERIDEKAVRAGRAAGVRGFVTKPIDMGRMERAVMDAAREKLQPPERPSAAASGRDTLDKLRIIPIFKSFNDLELVRLLKICKLQKYPAGQYIFREGEKGYNLYVMVSGRVEIRKSGDGMARVLVTMKPGDCFGEMAIIDDSPRFADAVAITDVTAIEVHESTVNKDEDMISLKLVRQIAILLANKLRR